MKTAWLLLLLLGVGTLGGCAVNPATGKSDFVMMSEQQELGMGARYNQEILKQFPRYNDEKLQAYVQRVGERSHAAATAATCNTISPSSTRRTSTPSPCRAATSISIAD